jgi:molybdopterin molybdotransferase
MVHLHKHHHPDMLAVEEALERILSLVNVLPSEEVRIEKTLGQVLATDVHAPFPIPGSDNSAMDGYAVQSESIRGACESVPCTLRVIGQIQAGRVPSQRVEHGTAIRIMTGALIPPGADTVIPFELTDEEERSAKGMPLDVINILSELPQGQHVRSAGEDVGFGELVLTAGTTVRPPEAGVLASLGKASLSVIRRPIVAVLATGDELLEPGQPLEPGKLYNSNSYAVAAAVEKAGGIPRLLGIARDDLSDTHRGLEAGLDADMVITSAGVSKGSYDLVKDVLESRGEISFWSVRMRPAKPIAFGLLHGDNGRKVPHLGLPGNPVSALVAFEQFGRPAILKMMGKTRWARPTIQAVLENPISNHDGRRVYARVVVTRRKGTYYARLAGSQGSNILMSMVRANGLAICPEDVALKEKGDTVVVQMVDWNEEVDQ